MAKSGKNIAPLALVSIFFLVGAIAIALHRKNSVCNMEKMEAENNPGSY